jgi:hypothetical protein
VPSVQQARRHGQAPGAGTADLVAQEVAVQAAGRRGALGLAVAGGVDLLGAAVVGAAVAPCAAQEHRDDVADDPRTEPGRGQRRLIGQTGQRAQRRRDRLPRMRDAGCDETGEALRRRGHGQEGGPPAPVVAEQQRPLDAQDIKQRDRVLCDAPLAEVGAVGRLGGPAQAPQVHREHASLRGQERDDAPPHPPVLWKAVQREHGRRVGSPRDRDVDAHARREVVEDVCDARKVRRVHVADASRRVY